jgi:ech hydrogenase subunit E
VSRMTVVPLGPQHPVLVEPIHLKLSTREEVVEDVEVHIGYNHRGMERLLENDWKKNTPVSERVCGICSHQHSTTYCQAVERIMGVEVPERALYIRTIMLELQRIHSHMLILGLLADAIGYENLFMQIWRDREIVMGLVERISGNRVHYAMNIVGGVRRDIDYDMDSDIIRGVEALEERFDDLDRILRTDGTWLSRTRGVGRLARNDALRLGAVGPVARGSDVPYDIRTTVAHPFAAYQMLQFHPILEEGTDVWSRAYVRMRELFQSADLVRQCIDGMRDGPIQAEVKGHPNGEAFSRVEASRGELVYYVKGLGRPELERVKIRTPTFANIPSLVPMLLGADLADVPPIVTSIDPCICCTDR